MSEKFRDIDHYIGTFPDGVREVLEEVRQTIRKAVPEAEETISYNIPTFKLGGRYLIYFAGWTKHISIYPIPGGDEELEEELEEYRTGPGTLRFPLNEPLPLPLIERVVAQMAKGRR